MVLSISITASSRILPQLGALIRHSVMVNTRNILFGGQRLQAQVVNQTTIRIVRPKAKQISTLQRLSQGLRTVTKEPSGDVLPPL
jgi:hypothetical protein